MVYNCYFNEVLYALYFSMFHSLSSLTSFNSFYLLFAVENRNDKPRVAWAKLNSTFMKIWLLIVGIAGAKFQITRYRKTAYSIGLFLLAINWLIMSIFFYNNSFAYTIPGGYVVATLEGTCFMSFYAMVLEVCGEDLFTFSVSAYMIYNTMLSTVSPFFIPDPSYYASYCLGTGIMVFC